MYFLYALPATFITVVAMSISAVSAFDHGGTFVQKGLLAAVSLCIAGGAHFSLAISRQPAAWVIWIGCLMCTLLNHTSFIVNSNIRANDVRAMQSVEQRGIKRQIDADQVALAAITARPLPTIRSELVTAEPGLKRAALKAEQEDAKRATKLRDDLIILARQAADAENRDSIDPVTAKISVVTGVTPDNVLLLMSLASSIFLELTASFLWYRFALLKNAPRQLMIALPETSYAAMFARVEAELAANRLKPTVKSIRLFLRCAQDTAVQIHRDLIKREANSPS